MTPNSPMTASQQIEYLATKMMEWEKHYRNTAHWTEADKAKTFDYKVRASVRDWNPLTDWNHWRQVEEKVMQDRELSNVLFHYGIRSLVGYIHADLPTRTSALISAHQQLYG